MRSVQWVYHAMALMSFVDVVQAVSAESAVVVQIAEAADPLGSLQQPLGHLLCLCTMNNGTHAGYTRALGSNEWVAIGAWEPALNARMELKSRHIPARTPQHIVTSIPMHPSESDMMVERKE